MNKKNILYEEITFGTKERANCVLFKACCAKTTITHTANCEE